jgi:hypothetical protein
MQNATSLPVFHGRITIPELVTRPDLLGAVTLNGVGVNLARAVGPALGSSVVAAAGLGAVFLLNVEYRIDPERSLEFTKAMQALSVSRRRDGAIRWGLFYDTADPSRYLETFAVESWAEHLRQHERVTVADRAAQQRASAFQIGEMPPIVSHLIYAHESMSAAIK